MTEFAPNDIPDEAILLDRLFEARRNLTNEALIEERIAERRRRLGILVIMSEERTKELRRQYDDIAAHRKIVEGNLKEEERLAKLLLEGMTASDSPIVTD